MKLFNLLLPAILVLPQVSRAEVKIECVIRSDEEYKIKLYTPINDNYNLFFLDNTPGKSISQPQKNFYIFSFNLERPFFIDIFLYNIKSEFSGRLQMLVFPNDSLVIVFDIKKDFGVLASVEGNNAAGHNLYAKLNANPSEKFRLLDTILNDFSENVVSLTLGIDDKVKQFCKNFLALKDKNKISEEYLRILTKNIQMNYYDYVVRKLLTPSFKTQTISRLIKNSAVEAIFKKLPISDLEIKQLSNSYLYYMDYLRYLTYRKFDYKDIEEIVQAPNDTIIGNNKVTVPKDYSFVLYSDNDCQIEDIWALSIGIRLRFAPGQYDIDVLNQFNLLFPNSKWAQLLVNQFKEYSKIEKTTYKLQMPVVIVDSVGSISSLNSIKNKLNNSATKYFFVDCWATWCSPCIGAFSYNLTLDSFLNKVGITRVYVSVDNMSNKKNWLLSIEKYKLGGYHIIAGKALVEDIQVTLKMLETDPFYIPKYFFIDIANNKIYQDIPPPSNTTEFINRVKSLIQ